MTSNTIRNALVIASLVSLAGLSMPLAAHDTPNMKHTHAFEQTGYGTYRRGHTVNNELGSITIWSPRPYTGYQAKPPVKFARPEPIRKAPGSPNMKPAVESRPVRNYGKPKYD
jgi:hypothetical protein